MSEDEKCYITHVHVSQCVRPIQQASKISKFISSILKVH